MKTLTRGRIKILAGGLLVFFLFGTAFAMAGLWGVGEQIQKVVQQKQLIPKLKYSLSALQLRNGQKVSPANVVQMLERQEYRRRDYGKPLNAGDYSVLTAPECQHLLSDDSISSCLAFRSRTSSGDVQMAAFSEEKEVRGVYQGNPPVPAPEISLEPQVFAQYIGDQAILFEPVTLADSPPFCLNSLLAIEDAQFLEHRGISASGMFRALWRNVTAGRAAQGGSTLTQQLVKNYFLTPEKTLTRKVREIILAVALEAQLTKDEILEMYLNEIYLGQNGPFQVRGYGAAARHYFDKNLKNLEPTECALLAAIVNSPGAFDPRRHPERALQRRNLVFDRMLSTGVLAPEELDALKAQAIQSAPERVLGEPAPFFLDAARRFLQRQGISLDQGLSVQLSLDPRLQESAQKAVRSHLERLEKNNPLIKENLSKNMRLEGALLAADPQTGLIRAAVGGRDFRKSQFNRTVQSERQAGSTLKPIVFLAALLQKKLDPLTPLTDAKTTIQFDKQEWTPANYDDQYFQNVPAFWALARSLNAATVDLALKTGLKEIVEIGEALGIDRELIPLPSVALGAPDLSMYELLQIYSTLANLGHRNNLSFVTQVTDDSGNVLYRHSSAQIPTAPEAEVAVLTSMLQGTFRFGTAKFAGTQMNFEAAGKTGTTSDYKDAWFAGYTPDHVALVWVGYDDNTPHKLTGASGALPIWLDYMKNVYQQRTPQTFSTVPGTRRHPVEITAPDGESLKTELLFLE